MAEIADESVIPPPAPDEDLEEGIKAERGPPITAKGSRSKRRGWTGSSEWVGERVTDEPGPTAVEEPAASGEEAAPEPEQAAPADVQTEASEPEEKPRRGRGRKKAAEPEPRKSARPAKKKAEKPEAKKATESRARKPAAKSTKRTSRKGKEEQTC